ncbi:unnamed protein product [Closterium sp. NIES-53]
MRAYVNRVEELGERLVELDASVEDNDWIMMLLAGLGEAWSTVITMLDGTQDTWKKEQVVARLINEEARPSSSDDNRRAHVATCDNNDREFIFVASGTTVGVVDAWVPDTGATQHMTACAALLNNVTTVASVKRVMFGNHDTLDVTGQGDLRLMVDGGPLTIKNVLVVLGLGANLLFVSQFTRKGMRVNIEGTMMVLSTANGVHIGTARQAGGLFVLDALPSVASAQAATSTTSLSTWHNRLGHLHLAAIQAMAMKGIVDGLDFVHSSGDDEKCVGCLEGKMARKHFPPSTKPNASEPLELVHTDLCGPITPVSKGGAHYVLTLIDGATRICWIRLLKHEDATSTAIKKWSSDLEKESDFKVKRFRSDGGGEYIARELGDWEGQGRLHRGQAREGQGRLHRGQARVGHGRLHRVQAHKKLGPNGEVERYKTRLVAQGYTQKEGFHYNETFAPVAKSPTLRTLLALAGALDLQVEQLDVKTAFLYGRLKEEVYMKQPPGFDDNSDCVCKLKRTIYGLKQNPRAWYTRIDEHLPSLGFVRSECDHALYVLNKDEKKLVLLLYVDDLLLVSDSKTLVADMKTKLAAEFSMRDLGAVTHYLGMHIHRDRENKTLALHQHKYLENVVDRFGMIESKPTPTPMEAGFHPLTVSDENPMDPESAKAFHSVVGSCMYAALSIRPDLSFPVGVLGRVVSNPMVEHVRASRRLLHYIKGTT